MAETVTSRNTAESISSPSRVHLAHLHPFSTLVSLGHLGQAPVQSDKDIFIVHSWSALERRIHSKRLRGGRALGSSHDAQMVDPGSSHLVELGDESVVRSTSFRVGGEVHACPVVDTREIVKPVGRVAQTQLVDVNKVVWPNRGGVAMREESRARIINQVCRTC